MMHEKSRSTKSRNIVLFMLDNRRYREEQDSEPLFVNLLRCLGIDSQPGGPVPVPKPYLSYRPARLHWLAGSIPRNRFLGSINV
jgi:hypothetical protein